VSVSGALSRSGVVFRCAQVAAGAIACLPLKEYRDKGAGDREEIKSTLLEEPHRELTQVEWKELVALHIMSWGDAFLAIERNQAGAPIYLDPLHPAAVSPRRVQPTEANPYGRVYDVQLNPDLSMTEPPADSAVTGPTKRTYTPEQILHIPGLGWDGVRGLSPIGAARKGIASSVHAEEYAEKLWRAGGLQSGILKSEAVISKPQAQKLKAEWQEKTGGLNGAQEIAVLDGNVAYQQISINPKDAQFVEARQFQSHEIASFFGLNAELMPADAYAWLKFFLLPYLRRIEARVSRLLPRQRFAEFTVDGLLRADLPVRFAAYAVGLQNGFISLNQIERWENWPLTPGGDVKTPLQAGVGTPNAHVLPQPQA
jgi:HK97 family phage portal protein